jgi:hypothetical protein
LTEGWEKSIEGFTIESHRQIALGRNHPVGVIANVSGGTQDVSSLSQSGRRCCSACQQIQAGRGVSGGHELQRVGGDNA